jgi:hypothetical protein
MDRRHGPSGGLSALQTGSPEFEPHTINIFLTFEIFCFFKVLARRKN